MNLDQFKNISDIFDLDKLPNDTKGDDLRFMDKVSTIQPSDRDEENYKFPNTPYQTTDYAEHGVKDNDEDNDDMYKQDTEMGNNKKYKKMVDAKESLENFDDKEELNEKKAELSNNDLLKMYSNAEKKNDKKLMKQLENTMKGRKIRI